VPRSSSRPSANPVVTLAVFGQGETDEKNIDALLTDAIDAYEKDGAEVRFIFPVGKDETTETVKTVLDWVDPPNPQDGDPDPLPYDVIQVADPKTKGLREIADGANKVHEVKAFTELADILSKANTGDNQATLLFLWDDSEPDADQKVLWACHDAGIDCKDFIKGMADLQFGEGDDDRKAAGDGDEKAEPPDDFATWPIRRARTWVKDNGYMTAAEVKSATMDELLEALGIEGDNNEPEPEKPARGRGRSRAAAKDKDDEPPAEPAEEPRGRGRRATVAKDAEADKDTGEITETPAARIAAGVADLLDEKTDDDGMVSAAQDVLDAVVEAVLDAIAARVEKEPEDSAVRKAVAPPRPPGRPRGDGEAPTRRRSSRR